MEEVYTVKVEEATDAGSRRQAFDRASGAVKKYSKNNMLGQRQVPIGFWQGDIRYLMEDVQVMKPTVIWESGS
ncbi:hypothetical protein ABZP36_009873 [Zizania latifolia]